MTSRKKKSQTSLDVKYILELGGNLEESLECVSLLSTGTPSKIESIKRKIRKSFQGKKPKRHSKKKVRLLKSKVRRRVLSTAMQGLQNQPVSEKQKMLNFAKLLSKPNKGFYGRSEIMEINYETGLQFYQELKSTGFSEKDALELLSPFLNNDTKIFCLETEKILLSSIPVKFRKNPKNLKKIIKAFENICLEKSNNKLLLLATLAQYGDIRRFKDWEVESLRQRIHAKKFDS